MPGPSLAAPSLTPLPSSSCNPLPIKLPLPPNTLAPKLLNPIRPLDSLPDPPCIKSRSPPILLLLLRNLLALPFPLLSSSTATLQLCGLESVGSGSSGVSDGPLEWLLLAAVASALVMLLLVLVLAGVLAMLPPQAGPPCRYRCRDCAALLLWSPILDVTSDTTDMSM